MSQIDGVAFIHGGAHGAWDWSDVRKDLLIPSIAIDLPGRGQSDEELAKISLADWVDHAADEIRRQGWSRVLLVGHSLAGITMPGVAEKLGDRVAHIIYLSCQVPPEGKSAADNMPPGVRDMVISNNVFAGRKYATHAGISGAMRRISEEKVCNDAGQPFLTPVSRKAVAHIPSTYVRFLEDEVISNARQQEMIANLQPKYDIPVHGYHFTHISQPDIIVGIIATILAVCNAESAALS